MNLNLWKSDGPNVTMPHLKTPSLYALITIKVLIMGFLQC